MSKDGLSAFWTLFFHLWNGQVELKIAKTPTRGVDSPSFLLLFWTLGAVFLSLLPTFLLFYSVCYECISLIHNKSGCWILDEYLQCAREHFVCSISFNLHSNQLHCFIPIGIHLNHFLYCITTIFHILKCPNVG